MQLVLPARIAAFCALALLSPRPAWTLEGFKLRAVDPKSRATLWIRSYPGPFPRKFSQCGKTLCVFNKRRALGVSPATGEVLWYVEPSDARRNLCRFAASGGAVFLADDSFHTLRAYGMDSGKELWSTSIGGNGIGFIDPQTDGGLVVFVRDDGAESSYRRTSLIALDARTGKLRWQATIAPVVSFLLAGKSVFVADRQGALSALDAKDGRERWKLPVAGSIPKSVNAEHHFSALTLKDTVLFAGHSYSLGWQALAIAEGGTLLWKTTGTIPTFNYAFWANGPAVVSGGTAAISFGKGVLQAFDAKTGRLRYSWEGRAESWVAIGERLFFAPRVGLVYHADLASGRLGSGFDVPTDYLPELTTAGGLLLAAYPDVSRTLRNEDHR